MLRDERASWDESMSTGVQLTMTKRATADQLILESKAIGDATWGISNACSGFMQEDAATTTYITNRSGIEISQRTSGVRHEHPQLFSLTSEFTSHNLEMKLSRGLI